MNTSQAKQSDDFLTRYMDYATDNFCPDEFHYWTGLSVLAGALENKVCFYPEERVRLYPNIYVLLLADPGAGKSTAGERGVNLLKKLVNREGNRAVKILPQQVTEGQLVQIMEEARVYDPAWAGSRGPLYRYSAGYWWASEASDTLKSIYGDFTTCLTSWYDCPSSWHRSTKTEHGGVPIPNVCMNLLAGCTFSFLSELIPKKHRDGGFASRLFYVVHDQKHTRTPKFGAEPGDKQIIQEKENWLVSRLAQVNKLYGQMKCDEEWKEVAQDYFARCERERVSSHSIEKKNFLARKHTNAFKLSMLLSISESCDMVIRGRHLMKAIELMEYLDTQLSRIMDTSRQADSPQSELTYKIYEIFERHGKDTDGKYKPMSIRKLKTILLDTCKANTNHIRDTFKYMYENQILSVTATGECFLIRNPKEDSSL